MRHMLDGQNIALITTRQVAEGVFNHALGTNLVSESRVTISNKGMGYVFPLFLTATALSEVSKGTKHRIAWKTDRRGRIPNLNPEIVAQIERSTGLRFDSDGRSDLQTSFGPADILGYVYAVLNSPSYRTRFADGLKIDFPRVPPPKDRHQFTMIASAGSRLTHLHLLDSTVISARPRYPVKGSNIVEKGFPRFVGSGESAPNGDLAAADRVYINTDQYFEPVPREAWEARMGGYHVADKWLKERIGRTLGFAELEAYQLIVGALSESQRLLREIEEIVPKVFEP